MFHVKRHLPNLLFLFALLIIVGINNYSKTSFLPPVSIHSWRQADGASFALNYAKNGMDFFKPELHNLNSDNFTTGYGVSEAPLIYYFVAILYSVFGVNELFFRLTELLIVFSTIFFLFTQLRRKLENPFAAAFVALLPFTSTVFLYYANSFIPDYISLSLMLLAGCQFLIFQEFGKKRNLFFLFLFVILSGLLKVTDLSPFIALTILFLITIVHPKYRQTFKFKSLWITGFFISYVIIGAWYLYAIHFNRIHHTSYFANEIHPAFKYTWISFKETLDLIWNRWHAEWFHRWIYYLIPAALVISITLIKRFPLFIIYLLTLLAGTIIYFSLWFEKFINHDYYIAPFFPIFIVATIGLFLAIKEWIPKVYKSPIAGVFLLLIIVYPISRESSLNRHRYDQGYSFDDYESYRTLGKLMKEKGIDRNTKIISYDDFTYAVSLYLMDFKGWTSCQYVFTPVNTIKIIEKGASFLIFKGDESINKYPLPQLLKDEFLSYKNLKVYDLRQTSISLNDFDFDTIHTDMEIKGSEGTIATNNPLIFVGNESCRTTEKAHSGQFSVKLDIIQCYGLTTILTNIQPGDTLLFRVWRFGNQGNGSLIIRDSQHQAKWTIPCKTEASADEWSLFEKHLPIPANFVPGELHLFFYNPNKDPIYFDDLEIVKTK